MAQLDLKRPLAILDTETTGTHVEIDRIVEFAAIKLHPDGTQEDYRVLINPGISIPPESTRIHKITDEMVKEEPTLDKVADKIQTFLSGCDIGGYNITRFDIRILNAEFKRAGFSFELHDASVIDVQGIFFKREPRTLGAAAKFYCNKTHENAHSALADCQATLDVLLAQGTHYPDLPSDVPTLAEQSTIQAPSHYADSTRKFVWKNAEACFNFGKKHLGKTLRQVHDQDPGYLEWMLKATFSEEVQGIVRNALDGQYPSNKST